jgi:hypothetical protein
MLTPCASRLAISPAQTPSALSTTQHLGEMCASYGVV